LALVPARGLLCKKFDLKRLALGAQKKTKAFG